MKEQSELTSFASAGDLAAVWRSLSDEESDRADALLLEASNYLRQVALNNVTDLDEKIQADTSGIFSANVKTVVMNAVRRAMAKPCDMPPDANQWSQSASPYSESMSFGGDNSSDIYFKSRELQVLGLDSISGKSKVTILRGVR